MSQKKLHRYPGLKPFSSAERQLFYGREKDIKDLKKLILIEKLLVLHSKSGLGKSSLLNAGIRPELEKKKDLVVIKIRFSAYTEGNIGLLETVRHLILETLENPQAPSGITAAEDRLWYICKQFQLAQGKNTNLILIFDQFEEAFTYPQSDLNKFKTQLAHALNSSMPRSFQEAMEAGVRDKSLSNQDLQALSAPLKIRALFAIRSDKLSLLDELKDVLPDILNHTYRLLPLNRLQAEDAILNPAYQKGDHLVSRQFDFSDEALDAILDFLTHSNTQDVESFQLQIICQYVENLVINEGKKLIERKDLGKISDIFENYYESLISRLSDSEKLKAQKLMEEGLILESEEIRLSLHEGQITEYYGIGEELLKKLSETRLIRRIRSPRGGHIYELSHDTLVKPILKAKERRFVKKENRRMIRFFAIGAGTVFLLIYGLGKWNEYRQALAFKDEQHLMVLQNADRQQEVIDSLLKIQSDQLADLAEKASTSGAEDVLEAIEKEKKKVDQKLPGKNSLESLIEQMYHADETVRRAATAGLTRRLLYSGDQAASTLGKIVRYGNAHPNGRNEGHWGILFLLDEKVDKDEYMKVNMASIQSFLNSVNGKYGSRTQGRIERIQARIENL